MTNVRDIAIARGAKQIKGRTFEPVEAKNVTDLKVLALALAATPSEMGDGELPEDEKNKKDAYNKQKAKALASRKK